MVDNNKTRVLEEHSRRTNDDIQEVRIEVKMQETEIYNKLEQLQLQMETLLPWVPLRPIKTVNEKGGRMLLGFKKPTEEGII